MVCESVFSESVFSILKTCVLSPIFETAVAQKLCGGFC